MTKRVDFRFPATALLIFGSAVLLESGFRSAPPNPKPTPAVRLQGAPIDGSVDPPRVPFQQVAATPTTRIVLKESATVETLTVEGKDYRLVNFGLLAGYTYHLAPDAEVKAAGDTVPASYQGQIPQPVRDLDNHEVVVDGFMVPLEVEAGRATSFVLLRDQMLCCFGIVPEMNEWIQVTMEPDRTAPIVRDSVVRVRGRLQVGEHIEDGAIMSLYRMQAEAAVEGE